MHLPGGCESELMQGIDEFGQYYYGTDASGVNQFTPPTVGRVFSHPTDADVASEVLGSGLKAGPARQPKYQPGQALNTARPKNKIAQ